MIFIKMITIVNDFQIIICFNFRIIFCCQIYDQVGERFQFKNLAQDTKDKNLAVFKILIS